jgi:hypothetical protein
MYPLHTTRQAQKLSRNSTLQYIMCKGARGYSVDVSDDVITCLAQEVDVGSLMSAVWAGQPIDV